MYTLAAAQTGGASRQACLLCEHPAIIRFSPCGHTVLCSRCAERAKKCLQCKVSELPFLVCDRSDSVATINFSMRFGVATRVASTVHVWMRLQYRCLQCA